MRSEDIPQELIDILDERAGKLHSRNGPVITALAEILTAWDNYRGPAPCGNCRWGGRFIQLNDNCPEHGDEFW
jgi:hypothetical protein